MLIVGVAAWAGAMTANWAAIAAPVTTAQTAVLRHVLSIRSLLSARERAACQRDVPARRRSAIAKSRNILPQNSAESDNFSILPPRLGLDAGAYPVRVCEALTGLWQLAGHLIAALMWADTPERAVLLSVAALTVAVLAAKVAGSLEAGGSLAGVTGAIPVRRRVAALKESSWRVAFLPQRDPDARGRSRPRAPSAAQAAA